MLNYIALCLLIFVIVFLFYTIIVIHDIPYEIAKKRKHPHQDAIHTAGWISLLTLHVIWPFLWIWATLYREDRGWGMSSTGVRQPDDPEAGAGSIENAPTAEIPVHEGGEPDRITALNDRIAELEARLDGINPGA